MARLTECYASPILSRHSLNIKPHVSYTCFLSGAKYLVLAQSVETWESDWWSFDSLFCFFEEDIRAMPVAKITPVGGGLACDARRTQLAPRGIIRPGNGQVSRDLLENLPVLHMSQKDIARIIGEEHEDRI